MDNPYWSSDGQRHHLDLETVQILSFELASIISASKNLAEQFDLAEFEHEEELTEDDLPLLRLHQRYAFVQVSKTLLLLALVVRTYDDQMRESERAKAYEKHVEDCDGGDYVGILDGDEELKFYVRDACNKIIHASEVRPLYERVDRTVESEVPGGKPGQDIWYLTGEIELQGRHFKKDWKAVLHVEPFLEVILSIIEFGDP